MAKRTHRWRRGFAALVLVVTLVGQAGTPQAQSPNIPPEQQLREPEFTTPLELLQYGKDQQKALKVNEAIFQAIGFGNTFLVVTPGGNVVIDTSLGPIAPRHKRLLEAVSKGPIKYLILTHAHGDHTGGVGLWRQPETKIVAQKQHVDFMHYQTRLEGFYALRNAAQFGRPRPEPKPLPGNFGAKIVPNVLFDDNYEFELGGLKFEVLHTPGETPDHATVWIPKFKAAFVGDNFYRAFPNLYTLRGTPPRSALEYIASLNKVLALKPELLLPSHGLPVRGNAEITRDVTRYRDAIQFVHDEVVKGMNAGKDVWTLLREIRLPKELDWGESYGRLDWSVRGIYEGYVGWFDGNPAMMYGTPPTAVYPEVVQLAGGPDALATRAAEHVRAGRPVEALHLLDMALAADNSHRPALETRLKALDVLQARCRNTNERGWLDHASTLTRQKLAGKP